MKIRKIIKSSIVIGILFIIFDMVTAISISPIFSYYSDLPIWKNPPNIVAGIVFDLINGFILVTIYSIIYNGIPGLGLKKGLNYGIMIAFFRVVMSSFSAIVMYNIPLTIIVADLIANYFEIVILCILLSLIYEKFR